MAVVINPFEFFTDTSGAPLNGFIYVGQNNKNPEAYPIDIYFDASLTQLAGNPLKVINGYIYNYGTAAQVYTSGNYSLTIKDVNYNLVTSILSLNGNVNGTINSISNLIGLQPPYSGYGVNLLSFHDGLSLGGGLFYYDANLSATNHNGGSIIDPTKVFPTDWSNQAQIINWFSPNSGGMGCWVRDNKNCDFTDFGAKADKTTNDTKAIQQTIYAYAKYDINLVATKHNYLITDTILLPIQNLNYTQFLKYDFGDSIISTTLDITLITSAYYNGSNWVTNVGTTLDSNISFSTIITNISLASSFGITTNAAIRIQDLHQGSKIENISILNFTNAIYANNCYYSEFKNIITTGTKVAGQARFVFDSNSNLMTIKKLVSSDSNIGYNFKGLVDAIVFENNSIEGIDIGVKFDGEVRGIILNANYIENITQCAYYFGSYIYSAKISNNYINFNSSYINSCIYKYLPSPINNIIFDNSNNLNNWNWDLAKIQQTINGVIDNSLGQSSNVIELKNSASPKGVATSMLLTGNMISTRNNFKQIIDGVFHKAAVVNNFAVGNYTGAYSGGFTNSNKSGFIYVSTGSNSFYLDTLIWNFEPQSTSKVYINIQVTYTGGTMIIIGEYINGKFYKLTDTGYAYDNTFLITGGNSLNSSCYRFTKSGLPNTITDVSGEIRLI